MNIRKIIYFNCGERYKDTIDHHSYTKLKTVMKSILKCEKNSGLNGIRTHDLCDTRAVFYQASYQANGEL